MESHWRGRALIAVLIAFAILDVAAWAFVFHRGAAKSSYVSLEATGQPSSPLTPVPTAAPSSATPQPAALALPDKNGAPLAVSIVSDAIGTGHYASSAANSYRSLVETALRAKEAITVTDVSAPASNSTDVTAPAGQDLVVLEVGTYDLGDTNVKTFTANYAALVAATKTSSPKAALVCVGTWSGEGVAFDTAIRAACQYVGGAFVSLGALYADAANRGPAGVAGPYGTSDDQAPNDAGHRAIAAALLGAVGLTLS